MSLVVLQNVAPPAPMHVAVPACQFPDTPLTMARLELALPPWNCQTSWWAAEPAATGPHWKTPVTWMLVGPGGARNLAAPPLEPKVRPSPGT